MFIFVASAFFLGGVIVGGIVVAGSKWFTQPSRELKATQKRLNLATRTLNKISSDSVGLPVLEAQITLDEIERTK